jgi:hypothetical protein
MVEKAVQAASVEMAVYVSQPTVTQMAETLTVATVEAYTSAMRIADVRTAPYPYQQDRSS